MSQQEKPLFSIAMPAYNAGGMIAETLDSVITQTLEDWEVVVVDDGSSDSTGAIADEYAARDSRIRVIHQANAGCGPARGTAVENARGRLIARLDQDDMYVPTYLEEMARFIEENPDYEIYSCNGEMFFPDGRTMLYHREPRYAEVMSLSFADMAMHNGIFSPTVFRPEIFEPAGGFRPGVYTEDYDLWLRTMARGARHIYLPKVLVRYRISESQMSVEWLKVWEGEVGVMTDLLVSGVLDIHQSRAVRSGLKRRWRQRATKAFEVLLGRDGRASAAPYFPSRDTHKWPKRAVFVVSATWFGSLAAIERGLRALVSGAIRIMRAIFPFLRGVRLRRK